MFICIKNYFEVDQMTTELKAYVKKNLDLIDTNDYETLYKNIAQAYHPPRMVANDVGALTELLLECNVKPDEYMLEIPGAYLYRVTTISSYRISTNITKISSQAFGYCSIESIDIPDSVCEIGTYAFADCTNLTSITIPKSVTSIGTGAFYGCARINTISYKGTVEEWKHIDIAPGSFDHVLTSIVRCTDGVTRTQ